MFPRRVLRVVVSLWVRVGRPCRCSIDGGLTPLVAPTGRARMCNAAARRISAEPTTCAFVLGNRSRLRRMWKLEAAVSVDGRSVHEVDGKWEPVRLPLCPPCFGASKSGADVNMGPWPPASRPPSTNQKKLKKIPPCHGNRVFTEPSRHQSHSRHTHGTERHWLPAWLGNLDFDFNSFPGWSILFIPL